MTENHIPESEDRGLFEQVKRGSEDAFREVYRKYHRILYAVALKMLKDRDAAENAVQHVFVKLWLCRQDLSVMLSLLLLKRCFGCAASWSQLGGNPSKTAYMY